MNSVERSLGIEQRPVMGRRLVLSMVLLVVFFGAFVLLSAEAQAKAGGGGKSASPSGSGTGDGSADKGGSSGGNDNPTKSVTSTVDAIPTGGAQERAAHTEARPSGGARDSSSDTRETNPVSATKDLTKNTPLGTSPLNDVAQKGQHAAGRIPDLASHREDATGIDPPQPAGGVLDAADGIAGSDALLPSVDKAQRVDPATDLLALPATDALSTPGRTEAPLALLAEPVTDPPVQSSDTVADPLTTPVMAPTTDPPHADPATHPLVAEPLRGAPTSPRTTEPIAAPTSEQPVALAAALAPIARRPVVLENTTQNTYSSDSRPATFVGLAARGAFSEGDVSHGGPALRATVKTSELSGAFSRSPDGLAFSGSYREAPLLGAATVATSGIHEQKPVSPLSPSGGLPREVAIYFGGSSSFAGGAGFHLLAVLALLSMLSWAGGLYCRRLGNFGLVSFPGRVVEIPG